MAQTIQYYRDSPSDASTFIIYRGGYDNEKHKGIDLYHRPAEFNNGYISHVDYGCIVFFRYEDDPERPFRFFGIDKNKDEGVELNLSICFDMAGRLVLFKDELSYRPERFVKTFKSKNSKIVKEWVYGYKRYSSKEDIIVQGWKFKSKDDYLICDRTGHELRNLIPELSELYKPELFYYDYQKITENLWNLEPYSLNTPWGLTPEQREILRQRDQKHIEEVRKERSQLEKQKELPGFCDHCGRPGADYVINPYFYEMYDEEYYEWMCPECYHEAAMDV